MSDIYTILKKKTELLSKGLFLNKDLIKSCNDRGIEINYGRRGGAGPFGGKYFLLDDKKTIVNVALWNHPKKTNLVLKENDGYYFTVYDIQKKRPFSKLKLIEDPRFYNLKTSEGISMKKIALVHGIDCLASTVYQKCKYWICGDACKFCGIELSLNDDTTILEKNHYQISEVITAAKSERRCSHLTLTSGTTDEYDKGANRYIDILKGLKTTHPDVLIHIQIEPIENLKYIDKLKKAGADTIGIHIEILDKGLRSKITPGKYKIDYQLFEDNWKHALEAFGKNQVDTFILTGFGENSKDLIQDLEKIISLGVIPNIIPARALSNNSLTEYKTNHKDLFEIYIKAAIMMKEYGVNPLRNKAGCVKCGGCSAINEAYNAV